MFVFILIEELYVCQKEAALLFRKIVLYYIREKDLILVFLGRRYRYYQSKNVIPEFQTDDGCP